MRGLANAALATKGTSTTEVTFVLDCNVATIAVAPDATPPGPRSSAAPAGTPEAEGATGGACAAAGGAVTVTTRSLPFGGIGLSELDLLKLWKVSSIMCIFMFVLVLCY